MTFQRSSVCQLHLETEASGHLTCPYFTPASVSTLEKHALLKYFTFRGGNTDSVSKSFLSIENQADTQTEKDKQLNKCTHNKLNDGTAPPDVFQRWREKVVTDFLKTWFERWLSRQRPLPPSLPNLSSILVTHMVKPRTKFYQLSSDLHTGALASTYV